MEDKKQPPTEYPGRTDNTDLAADQQQVSTEPVLAERRSSDNAFSRFSLEHNYSQHTEQFEKRTGGPEDGSPLGINSAYQPPTDPPPYTLACPGVVAFQSTPERGLAAAPFLPPVDTYFRHAHHTHSGHLARSPTYETFDIQRHPQHNQTGNWRDSQVPFSKLADDPQRNDSGGDDRHQDRPRDGDRRAEPPVYSPEHLPPQPPFPPSIPYGGYWPGQPLPGIGPYDRPRSPAQRYPFGPQPQPYPPSFQPPPSPFEHPVPPPYMTPHPYPPLPPHAYPPLASPMQGFPPRLPIMPFPPGGPGQGIRPPPDVPGVLPPAPFFGPPANPTLIIPPGTRTDFKLVVRQQPERARMCGFGEKDRRPIDPPPIVELIENNGPVSPSQKQTLVLQCTLWNEEGTEHRNIIRTTTGATAGLGSAEELPVQPEEKHARVMMGNIFANAVPLEDEHGKRGFFYIFPDLSIRVEGRYRLKFDLLRVVLPPGPPALPGTNHVAAEVLSDVFVVYAAKKFPGMMQSTELTKAIARQGIKISVRGEPRGRREGKGNTTKSRKRPAPSITSIEEEDEDDSVVSSENKRKRSAE